MDVPEIGRWRDSISGNLNDYSSATDQGAESIGGDENLQPFPGESPSLLKFAHVSILKEEVLFDITFCRLLNGKRFIDLSDCQATICKKVFGISKFEKLSWPT
jgi:hypothetical protein